MSIVKYAHKNVFLIIFLNHSINNHQDCSKFCWTIDQNIFCGIIVIYCVRVKG